MAVEITLSAGGYTPVVAGDVGKMVTDDGGNVGPLLGYNNATRKWLVNGSGLPAAGSVIAIATGTGAGTCSSSFDYNLPFLFDGTTWIPIYSTEPEEDSINYRFAEKVVPYKKKNIFQFLERENKHFTYGGRIFPDEYPTGYQIVTQLGTWAEDGTGLKTGTLILTTADLEVANVFIYMFNYIKPVGYPLYTYDYSLVLIER